jgi:flavin-binding protein dodecin
MLLFIKCHPAFGAGGMKGVAMSDQVYKSIEVTGASSTSIERAIQVAVEKASGTVRNMRWFEVIETRGRIEDGQVAQWQVTIKIGFALED